MKATVKILTKDGSTSAWIYTMKDIEWELGSKVWGEAKDENGNPFEVYGILTEIFEVREY